ncbi:MAG: PspC domain-containing protein [Chloroflexota bacterium]|nr:PspC domain-containing protein [Chloroflexota bacterium]
MNAMTTHKLYRARRGRWIAGIAKGMANWSGAPVALVRFLWILALLPGGVPGVLLYLICWLVIRREPISRF